MEPGQLEDLLAGMLCSEGSPGYGSLTINEKGLLAGDAQLATPDLPTFSSDLQERHRSACKFCEFISFMVSVDTMVVTHISLVRW